MRIANKTQKTIRINFEALKSNLQLYLTNKILYNIFDTIFFGFTLYYFEIF
jgi:hypothetical protein